MGLRIDCDCFLIEPIRRLPRLTFRCYSWLSKEPANLERIFPGMKKQYAISLFLASLLIIAFAAIAGSVRISDLPSPPPIGATIDDFKLPCAAGPDESLN